MRFFIIIFLSVFCISPSLADENIQQDTKVIAQDLANCSGVFQAMGAVMTAIGKPHAGKSFEDTGRGAYYSAAYLNHMSGFMPDFKKAVSWAEAIQETQKNYWLGLIETHTTTEEEVFPKDFMTQLDFCTALNPIQTEVINMMKDTIYTQQ